VSDASDVEPEIIHHDAQLLIVDKPPGLPTTAPTPTEPCLAHWVRDRFPDLQAHATSRLDSQVSGLVTFALTRSANRHLLLAGPGRGERAAATRYEVAARTPNATLLRLRPDTGRTHQLRVHAAKAGAPLFGDPLYQGARRKALPDGSVVTARRVMLHCVRVSFPSFAPGDRMQLEAPAPPDMDRVWRALGGSPTDLQP
jgi:23S rRNA-/tRNA-specific pseudouridylate synthase